MILTANNFKMLRFKIYQNLNHIFVSIFFLFFIFQFAFWFKTEELKPDIYIVPPVPSLGSIKAISLGDEQFYFRILGLRIENAGDSFGRFTALLKYDYSELYKWFKLLDVLDNQSVYIPSLVSNYYSQTQHKEDTRYLVQYLDEFASPNINKNWWWMFQAFIIANSTLKDDSLSLKLAYKLSENSNDKAPHWTKELPALVYRRLGEDCNAFLFINNILKENESGVQKISAEDMDFMRGFIKTHLENLKRKNFNPNRCQYNKKSI